MTIELIIYLMNIIGSLKVLFVFTTITTFIIFIIHCLIGMVEREEFTMPKWKKVLSGFAIVFLLISILLPSERTMAMMAAVHYGKEAVSSDMGKKVEAIIDQKLDSILKDSTK